MSNTYQPILLNKITDDVVIEILNAVIPSLKSLEVEYFVIYPYYRTNLFGDKRQNWLIGKVIRKIRQYFFNMLKKKNIKVIKNNKSPVKN